jgi:hypothetical protein
MYPLNLGLAFRLIARQAKTKVSTNMPLIKIAFSERPLTVVADR